MQAFVAVVAILLALGSYFISTLPRDLRRVSWSNVPLSWRLVALLSTEGLREFSTSC